MMKLDNVRGMGSVEYAAVQAYGARLSMRPDKLSQIDEEEKESLINPKSGTGFVSNRSQKRFGIVKNSETGATGNFRQPESNVIIDTR